MSPIPPILPSVVARAAAVAAIVLAAILGGCGSVAPTSVDGLLVATGGALRVTDGSGNLGLFDGPAAPVIAVTASAGRVVAATATGTLVTSSGSGGTRSWTDVAVLGAPGSGFPLMAVSPLGKTLALVVGDPQGATFELVLADVGAGMSRSIAVDRGLNGPPAWIGPGIVALDVIKPDGESALATIAIGTGAVTDDAIDGRVVSATLIGDRLAVDDPATGDVVVGEADQVGVGPRRQIGRLAGPAGSSVDSLAISPGGGRLAVVRRSDSGVASIDLYRQLVAGWTKIRTIGLTGDGPISIAWLQ
jgi:hypothetical protein